MACAAITAAISSAVKCGAAPATRRWILADRVSESRSVAGSLVQVDLMSVPARDSLGRIAHVRGIMVNAFGNFSRAATNARVSARQLRSLFFALTLQDVTGHTYWPSIGARDVMDDTFFRHGANIGFPSMYAGIQAQTPASGFIMGTTPVITADYGIPAQTGGTAGPYVANCGFYAPLTMVGAGNNPLAGLIPLAALQARSGQGSFRFQIGTSLPTVGAEPATGITFNHVLNGLGQKGLDVWLDVVYLPALAVGPTWILDSYTLPNQSGVLNNPDSTTEHCHLRYRPEDVTGSSLTGFSSLATINQITITTAGFTDLPGAQFQDADFRAHLGLIERDSAQTLMNAAQDLPMIGTDGYLQALPIVPYRPRGMGAVKGAIQYVFGNAGGNSFFRFNHRIVNCNSVAYADAMREVTQCPASAGAVMTDALGAPTDSGQSNGVVLVLDPKAQG